tara:strand:- start:8162 stop:8515 length:354 start_codon:yes stop_codon:yes gene_type:complete
MFKNFKYFPIILLLTLLTSCELKSNFIPKNVKGNNDKINKRDNEKKEKIEVRISCGEGNIEDFLKKGWQIKKEYSEEKICSWKSVPANKKCNMEKDKGCKITKPDIIGKETFYLLEK